MIYKYYHIVKEDYLGIKKNKYKGIKISINKKKKNQRKNHQNS